MTIIRCSIDMCNVDTVIPYQVAIIIQLNKLGIRFKDDGLLSLSQIPLGTLEWKDDISTGKRHFKQTMNTNPLTPMNPDVGMNEGIETGI